MGFPAFSWTWSAPANGLLPRCEAIRNGGYLSLAAQRSRRLYAREVPVGVGTIWRGIVDHKRQPRCPAQHNYCNTSKKSCAHCRARQDSPNLLGAKRAANRDSSANKQPGTCDPCKYGEKRASPRLEGALMLLRPVLGRRVDTRALVILR